MSGLSRRKHQRIKGKGLSARLHSANGSWICMVVNLSLGGAFVRCSRQLPPGTEVSIELLSAAARALRLSGRVANTLEVRQADAKRMLPGMGIEFHEMTENQTERLRELEPSLNGSTLAGLPTEEGGRLATKKAKTGS